MSFFSSVPSSSFRYRLSSRINVITSSCGRFQFSAENAYSVSTWMPSRADDSTALRTASTPAWWPRTRGRWRFAAHRPLPSMMMAMWAGSLAGLIRRARVSSGEPGSSDARSFSSAMRVTWGERKAS